ncbi:uncharacterized protein LOC132308763 [Cornus florida]|uniref:uncharacterized protein LOC132308763 n=1 Tax=Cornus florida TaxID=4283 RepID=UPI002899D4D7|nr:uncharacterized protein LOC132308763 [Cornus florida]XP_059662966.1 uncharacterized protein LOC132308763 [Cornus florida]
MASAHVSSQPPEFPEISSKPPPEKKQKTDKPVDGEKKGYDPELGDESDDESNDDSDDDSGGNCYCGGECYCDPDDPLTQKMMSGDMDSDDEREFALMLSNANITLKIPEVPAQRETIQETDSDDEEKMDELFWQYRKQAEDSNGFDVDNYPLLRSYLGLISPISWPNESEGLPKLIKKLSKKAIRQYNRDYKVNYDFVKVQKANQQVAAGFIYYITFEAKDANDGGSKIFQAEVFDGIKKTEVVSCRPKPPT